MGKGVWKGELLAASEGTVPVGAPAELSVGVAGGERGQLRPSPACSLGCDPRALTPGTQGPRADRLHRATRRPHLWQVTEDQRVLPGAEKGTGRRAGRPPGCVSPSSAPAPGAEVGVVVGGRGPGSFLGRSHQRPAGMSHTHQGPHSRGAPRSDRGELRCPVLPGTVGSGRADARRASWPPGLQQPWGWGSPTWAPWAGQPSPEPQPSGPAWSCWARGRTWFPAPGH